MSKESLLAKRLEIEIEGIVQGVGFRPFVYKKAVELSLFGSVCNSGAGVFIEAEGLESALENFLQILRSAPPALSRVDAIKQREIPIKNSRSFQITPSSKQEKKTMLLGDVALCDVCAEEMRDVANRRFAYPFINCIECGPRYTITQSLPFDREATSMAAFEMCNLCRAEYEDPASRRFHMQGISCSECSPVLTLGEESGNSEELIDSLCNSLKRGEIVALLGFGGFHLLCDATNEQSVLALRKEKRREAKPFAVMFQNMAEMEKECHVSKNERELLLVKERPIVLLERKKTTNIANAVAPNINKLGVFLPYAPLHELLLSRLDFPLVATSANRSDSPIITEAEELFKTFTSLKKNTLSNNRKIHNSCDDSVAMLAGDEQIILRLGRSFGPLSLHTKKRSPKKILALGARQKSTFALAFDEHVILSPYIGDLGSLETFEYFLKTLESFLRIYEFAPDVIACDAHPEYETSKWAKAYVEKHPDVALLETQHHHAHALACMAEHGLEGEALAFCFDGSGYGEEHGESSVWGGEVLRVTPMSFKRDYHLQNFSLLGGERAIKEPRRIALALLFELFSLEEIMKTQTPLVNSFSDSQLRAYHAMWAKNLNSPRTSSIGRLFDGAYALSENPKALETLAYEGESGLILEANASEFGSDEHYSYSIDEGVIGFEAMIEEIVYEKNKKQIAAKFINTLVEIIVTISKRHRELPIILSGGVFQNKTLLEKTIEKLKKEKISYYIQNKTPINDGGISLGQVYYAKSLLEKGDVL